MLFRSHTLPGPRHTLPGPRHTLPGSRHTLPGPRRAQEQNALAGEVPRPLYPPPGRTAGEVTRPLCREPVNPATLPRLPHDTDRTGHLPGARFLRFFKSQKSCSMPGHTDDAGARRRCRGTPTMPGHADDAGARLPTIPSISIGSHRNPSGFIRISSILAYEKMGGPPPLIFTILQKSPAFPVRGSANCCNGLYHLPLIEK